MLASNTVEKRRFSNLILQDIFFETLAQMGHRYKLDMLELFSFKGLFCL